MKLWIVCLSLLLSFEAGLIPLHAQNIEENKIRSTFENFKQSLLTERYIDAVAYTDDSMVDYFNSIKPQAVNEEGKPNPAATMLDQFLVEAMRKRMDHDELVKLDLPGTIAYAKRHNWFNLDTIKDVTLGAVTIQGDHARAEIIYKDKPTSFPVPFHKMAGQWKVDPLAFAPLAETLLKAEAMRHNFDTQATVDDLVDHIPNP